MEFRCQTVGGGDLCFNGGVCMNASIAHDDPPPPVHFFCACPDGWMEDFMWFHNPNCAMPEQFYLWFLVTFSILAVLALAYLSVLVLGAFRNKPDARRVLLGQMVTIVVHWTITLALYLEQGFFEGSIACHAISVLWSIYYMHRFALAWVLRPLLLATNAQPSVARRAYLLNSIAPAVNAVTFSAVFAAAIGVCRDPDPYKHNIVICTFMIVFALSAVFHYLVSMPVARRLYKLLDIGSAMNSGDQSSKARMENMAWFKMNAEKSRKQWNRILLTLSFMQTPVLLVYFVLGSFPYFYIYQAIYLLQIFVIAFVVTRFFTRKMNRTGATSSSAAGAEWPKQQTVQPQHHQHEPNDDANHVKQKGEGVHAPSLFSSSVQVAHYQPARDDGSKTE